MVKKREVLKVAHLLKNPKTHLNLPLEPTCNQLIPNEYQDAKKYCEWSCDGLDSDSAPRDQ
jgi:hypothetical protein